MRAAAYLRTVGSYIRLLGSHLGNKRLLIVGCRDEIRAVEITIRWLGGSFSG
ncbi:hypothetical protein RHMOL_Rhmol06G0195000 [Rhododendron molle]|uniref:Uncharacterized protein n=1 Tax=Rhododendron molle TaxID=49168 RepID=A0ACC0NGC8_RHOML|nr:hypothetical protein RHMOL_Rhmol06G0195000 [Rhododendron molle]